MPPAHHTPRGFRNPDPDARLRGLGDMLRWALQRWRKRGLFAAVNGAPPALATHRVRLEVPTPGK